MLKIFSMAEHCDKATKILQESTHNISKWTEKQELES